GAEEGKLEAPRPLAARRQRRLEPRREPLDAREHVLLARDRLVKALLRDIARDPQTRGQRFGFGAKRAVELAQEIDAEAGGERRARQVEDVADAFQADPRQCGDRLVRQAQRCEGQWRKTFALAATCIRRRRMAEARRGGSRADGGGDGGTCRKAEPHHAREEIAAKIRLAAEEMRAAADVEQNAVGRIDGGGRRGWRAAR